jgi:PleD family two-component response regulator
MVNLSLLTTPSRFSEAGKTNIHNMAPRILIVDDEGDFIELVKFRLADLGYEFLVANDGVQALSQARQHQRVCMRVWRGR